MTATFTAAQQQQKQLLSTPTPMTGAPDLAQPLGPEVEEGNIEYKLMLVAPPPERIVHLSTQMNWRLNEGHGTAVYMIGYTDDGEPTGLAPRELGASLKTLRAIAAAARAEIVTVARLPTTALGDRFAAAVTVRRAIGDIGSSAGGAAGRARSHSSFGTGGGAAERELESESESEGAARVVRVAVVGQEGAGKSTLVGVLTRGKNDNGRGLARMQVFRHNHEVSDGRTSSISHQPLTLQLDATTGEVLGVDSSNGNRAYELSRSCPVAGFGEGNFGGRQRSQSQALTQTRHCTLALLDQPGHAKYLKTTLFGLAGHAPDYALLAVDAAAGVQPMTREHMAIALALGVPLIIVVTKADLTPAADIAATLSALQDALAAAAATSSPPPRSAQAACVIADAAAAAAAGRRLHAALQQRSTAAGVDALAAAAAAAARDAAAAGAALAAEVEGGAAAEAAAEATVVAAAAATGGAAAAAAAAAATAGTGVEQDACPVPVPIVCVSNVTGAGLDALRALLGQLAETGGWECAHGGDAEVRIEGTYCVEGVGTVHAGTVHSGSVAVGDRLLMGPGRDGQFRPVTVESVHVSRQAARAATAGQTATFVLKDVAVGDVDDVTANVTATGGGYASDASLDEASSGSSAQLTVARARGGSGGGGSSAGSSPRLSRRHSSSSSSDGSSSAQDDGGGGIVDAVLSTPKLAGAVRAKRMVVSSSTNLEHQDSVGGVRGGGEVVPEEFSAELSGEFSAAAQEDGESTPSPRRRCRQGVVLLSPSRRPTATFEFEAEVMAWCSTINPRYAPVVHAHNIRQAAQIVSLRKAPSAAAAAAGSSAAAAAAAAHGSTQSSGICSGERAVCRFRFMHHPEYLRVGTAIVLREGQTRGFGRVLAVT